MSKHGVLITGAPVRRLTRLVFRQLHQRVCEQKHARPSMYVIRYLYCDVESCLRQLLAQTGVAFAQSKTAFRFIQVPEIHPAVRFEQALKAAFPFLCRLYVTAGNGHESGIPVHEGLGRVQPGQAMAAGDVVAFLDCAQGPLVFGVVPEY